MASEAESTATSWRGSDRPSMVTEAETTSTSWQGAVRPSMSLPSLRSSKSANMFKPSKNVTIRHSLPQIQTVETSSAESTPRKSAIQPQRATISFDIENADVIHRRKFFRRAVSSSSLKGGASSRSPQGKKSYRNAIKSSSNLAVSRATELMDGGIITDILLRDYIREQSQREALTAVWPDDLYQWYTARKQRKRKIMKLLKKDDEEVSSSDGEGGQINAISHDPVHIASLDRLSRTLEKQIFLFWRKVDTSKSSTPASAGPRRNSLGRTRPLSMAGGKRQTQARASVTGLFTGKHSSIGALAALRGEDGKLVKGTKAIDKFRMKVFDICQQHRETNCLHAEVEWASAEHYKNKEIPQFLLQDDQNIQRSATYNFWHLYHTDDSKLQHTLIQNARKRGRGKQMLASAAAASRSARKIAKMRDSMAKTTGSLSLGPRPSSRQQPSKESSGQPQKEMAPKLQPSTDNADQRPVWTPPGHSRPHSRVSSRGRKAHTPSATTRSGRVKTPQQRTAVQAVVADLPIVGGPGVKVLPFTILEAPPPVRSEVEVANPFGSFRSTQGGFQLSSMERHARHLRTNRLHKIGQDQRTVHSTLPMISHSMRGAEAYGDLQMAVQGLKKSSSEPSLMPAPPPVGDFAKTNSTPEKLPPVLGLAEHARMPLPPGRTPVPDTSAAIRYLEVCRSGKCVPRPAVLNMSQTCQILADSGEMLNDTDLSAFAAMVKSLDCLKTVDLSGNVLLSDQALVNFLKELNGEPAECSLTRLSFKGCRGSGRGTVHATVSLITHGLLKLQQLDLSGVMIPGTSWLPMCNAICTHPSLRSVHLADTGLGCAPNPAVCITNLLVSPRIEVLDLGWNYLSPAVFGALGEAVCAHKALKTIYLSNCTGARTATGETPISAFLEFLTRDRTLETLDVSCNGIEHKCALVLEAALENHAALTELRIGSNPLGVDGMRCFLRLLSRDSCGLVEFDVDGCESPEESAAGEPKFNPTNPAGRYSLDLSRVYDRTILRMLYNTCERLSISPVGAFKALEYCLEEDGSVEAAFEHPLKRDKLGSWNVPAVGFLEFVFQMQDVFIYFDGHLQERRGAVVGDEIVDPYAETRPTIIGLGAQEPQPVAYQYLQQHLSLARFQPSFRKATPLLRLFCSLHGQVHEQKLLLDALSRDFLLSFAQLKQLVDAGASVSETTSLLLHCLQGGEGHTYLALSLLLRDVDDFLIVSRNCHALLHCNIENPTGHYELDLENPADYYVAESLLLIDAWEAAGAQRKGCADLSMHGNWSSCRNCIYRNARILSMIEWRIPCIDKVKMDYVTWRRPPPQGKPLDDNIWTSMMLMLYTSWGRFVDKVTALRRISSRIYLKSTQLRELLGLFAGNLRVEVIVIFVLRLVDPQNTKVMRACLADQSEWMAVKQRVGTLHTFPHYQLEEFHFDMDLNVYEDRKATTLCVQIAGRERLENIRNPVLISPDGARGALEFGISMKWGDIDTLPSGSRFSFQYVCGPEDRQFEMRRDYAMKYGSWRANVASPKEVMWWKTLSEAPEVLLIFLYNCMRVFEDAKAVFKLCNRSKSGMLSRSEWEHFMTKMAWKEFKDDPSLTKQLFRYLDPDGGGEVSRAEWCAMQELWYELELSILEFFKFLDRTFSGNLDMAWEELDSKGAGAIGLQEWQEQVEFIGYHGHSTPIFHLVADGTGCDKVLSNQGWGKLKAFWDKRHELLQKILGLGEEVDSEDSEDEGSEGLE